ncbi:MAG TPA: GNAT family N-acetyltransferase [Mycobacteriales bacterium]|nr:GNAT family N-acetyltransferase [Mycobacteriales bacterium]
MTAPGRSLHAAPVLQRHVKYGVTTVVAEASRLAILAESVPGTPVTARWPWLAASVVKPAADEQPWMVGVTAGDRLVAAAVLLDVPGTLCRTTLAGTAEGHRGALLAVDETAATELGIALADALLGAPRDFTLGPVGQSPALASLLRELPIGLTIEHQPVPVVSAGHPNGIGMSHGVERTLRKARNRMKADGLEWAIDVTGEGPEITTALPLLESICRDRDHAGGRLSPLDQPDRRRLWHRRVLALAASGRLRLATLRLDGQLAAYVLGIEDGRSYRVLEGRYVDRWARYSPGRVLEAAMLERALEGASFDVFDWMTAVAPETLLAANDLDPLVVVRGRI